MSRVHKPSLLALLLLFAVPAEGWSTDAGASGVSKEYLTLVQGETRYLVRALERLQATIVQELDGHRERTLYRQADAALSLLVDFEAALKRGVSRAQLYARYAPFESRLSELLEAVEKLGKEGRAVQREASRVESEDEELHFALSAGDTSAERVQQVFKRQARRLVTAAKELEQTAQYALLKAPGQVSPGDFRKLVEAAAHFQKSAEAGAKPEQLRKDFREVDRAWQRAIEVLKLVKARENLHLVRTAAQMDRVHERLYRLLGLKEKDRPRLTIST